MIRNEDEVDKAFHLIIDAFDLNNIKHHIGLSACFSVVVNVMMKINIPNEKINVLLDAFEECAKFLYTETKIDKLPL